ncbi:MAG: head-tail adaptor protein [Pseudomonadota bacterium]
MIGKMDQRLTLQRATETPDGVGGTTRGWSNLSVDPCPWARVIAKAGRETMTEGRTTATFVVLFTIYNRDDLSELDRILWNGEAYNIRNLRREGGRRLHLVIEAERGVAN